MRAAGNCFHNNALAADVHRPASYLPAAVSTGCPLDAPEAATESRA